MDRDGERNWEQRNGLKENQAPFKFIENRQTRSELVRRPGRC